MNPADAFLASLTEARGAELMANRCAHTSKDMSVDWADAFTYAIVFGWGGDPEDPSDRGAWETLAAKHGWDTELTEFLIDTHHRFNLLRARAAIKNDDSATLNPS
ncbi:hypothetical protein [Aeromicrobium sp. 179-A 4D2 NHS]|uniref:hypothetical protein n=1 Tax=Aeromicrobium sp. 179-A 4D2 NHS TaxID=3142375 RepID=UPI0039A2784E